MEETGMSPINSSTPRQRDGERNVPHKLLYATAERWRERNVPHKLLYATAERWRRQECVCVYPLL
jgi:hypothetical protein